MEARTSQTAYCIGDIVAIDAYFKNNSNKNVKPKVSLLQKQIIRGQSATKTTRMSFQLIQLDPERVRDIKEGNQISNSTKQTMLPLGQLPTYWIKLLHCY